MQPTSTDLSTFGAFRKAVAGGPDSQAKERLVSAPAARSQIRHAWDKLASRREQMRAVQDAYDRMPPDTEADLRGDGLEGLSNVNWGGLQTAIDDAAEAFQHLALEPSEFCHFESAAMNYPEAGAGLEKLSKYHAKMLRKWPSLEDRWGLLCHHMVAHGLGIFYWPMPHSWHFRTLHPANLVVPERASCDADEWDWCAIVTEFKVNDLIAKLTPDSAEAAKAQGWDLAAIKTLLGKLTGADGRAGRPEMDVDAIVAGFASGNGSMPDSSPVAGFIYYVRDFDGTVSEYSLADLEADDLKPLYKRQGRFRQMSSFIAIFPLGLGDGYLNRVRGLGVNSLPFHDLEDRHNNRLVDASWISSSVGLKGDQEDLNRLSDMMIGPIFCVPDGLEINQVGLAAQIGPMMEVATHFDAKRAGRNRSMGGTVDTTPNVDRTATGARLRYQEQTGQRGGAIARFYRRASRFYETLWSRMADPEADTAPDPGAAESRAMLQQALASGLPPETLAGINHVTAKRLFGDGDPNNLFLALNDLSPFFGRLTAGAQRFFMRMLFAARLGNTPAVDALMIEPELDDQEQRARREAQLENAVFQSSDVAITVSTTDNHVIHAGEHLLLAEDTATQFQNGRIELEAAFQTLSRVREHNLGHLQALSQDPLSEPVFRDANNRWAAIDNLIKRLQQMLGDKREAERQAQLEELRNPRPSVKDQEAALTEDLRRRLAEAESAARIDTMKRETEAKIALTAADADFRREMERLAALGQITPQRSIPTNPADQ